MWTDRTGERAAGDNKSVEKEENPFCNIQSRGTSETALHGPHEA
jgi:hypothetical protein